MSLIILKKGGRVKKKKLPSIPKLKKKLWKIFSEWVRRGGVDKHGHNTCVTCGVIIPWKEGHAGHYIHGHSKASFLKEENVNFQCPRCNHFLSGNLLNYHDFMLMAFGQGVIDEIKTLSHQIWKPSRQELESLIEEYTKKVEALNVKT